MGLRDKYAKKIEEQGFRPIELNEGNVQAIFNRCLATADDPTDGIYASVLFQQDLGYEEDSKPVFFSKGRLEQNKKNIFYLLGQLRACHDLRYIYKVTSTETVYRYDGVKWTSDTVKYMELCHLGEATRGILPFDKRSNSASINELDVKPTLSPKDPAFPAWWEAHKGEWEQESIELALKSKEVSDPVAKYQKSAEAGDAEAQYQLGMYYIGKLDNSAADKWLGKAAAQGHKEANFVCGIRANEKETALKYFQGAAAAGHGLSKKLVERMCKKSFFKTEIIGFETAFTELLHQDVELTDVEMRAFIANYPFLSASLRKEYDAYRHRLASGKKWGE